MRRLLVASILLALLLAPGVAAQKQDPTLQAAVDSSDAPVAPGAEGVLRGEVKITADTLSPRLSRDGLRVNLSVTGQPDWVRLIVIEPAEVVFLHDEPPTADASWSESAPFEVRWVADEEIAECLAGTLLVEAWLSEGTMTNAKHATAEASVAVAPPAGCDGGRVNASSPTKAAPPAQAPPTRPPEQPTPTPAAAASPEPVMPAAADTPRDEATETETSEVPAPATGAVVAVALAALALRRRR